MGKFGDLCRAVSKVVSASSSDGGETCHCGEVSNSPGLRLVTRECLLRPVFGLKRPGGVPMQGRDGLSCGGSLRVAHFFTFSALEELGHSNLKSGSSSQKGSVRSHVDSVS